MPPATTKLKTSNITAELKYYKIWCDYFNTHKLGKAFQVDLPTTMHNDILQVTLDSVNSDFSIINQTGQILYKSPFKLWEGQNKRLASFNSSFLVNLHGKDNSTPDEGLSFVVAPDLNLSPDSYDHVMSYSTTDGNNANRLIALELDTFKEDIDRNSNHVGLNINRVRSNITTSLPPLGLVNFLNPDVTVMYYTPPLRPLPFAPKSHKNPLSQISVSTSTLPKNPAVEMELPVNPIPAVVLLFSLLAAATPVSARLKTCTITYDDFNISNSNTQKLHLASNDSTLASGALHLTLESDYNPPTNQSSRILYDKSFKLWESRNDTYSDRVASFNTSFLVILNQKIGFPIAGEGLTFLVAPDLNLPPNSFGGYLGLTNFTTDGNVSNQIIAIELDTFKEDFDPDSNHVGLNINSVISNTTTSLTPLGFELVPPYGTHNFFNVWVQYDGIKKVINRWNFISIIAILAQKFGHRYLEQFDKFRGDQSLTSGQRPVGRNRHVSTLSLQIRQQVAASKVITVCWG
ncbi:hypothetical protein RHSIM_Rhsim10G0190000 [Rhododendron simsii]|uniref:Legume lectin domain-containing protein n=1 Tax=Rhododendron simsii TaxID=118357 RepID=A0A834GBN2_RHOSS|nr:hypothetical protein RHSIM_Rhsim10G0190000 [Rhododendron simsii]